MSKVIRIDVESSLATESVNVFHWQIPGAGSQAAEIATCIGAMDSFYEAIKAYLSAGTLTIGERVVTVDQNPNQELASTPATVSTTGGAPTVLSAALLVGMRGASIGGRYRGRKFLGPLDEDLISSDGTSIDPAVVAATATAWATLVGTTTNSVAFGTWSKTYGIFTAATASVVRGAVKTQRRRLT